MEYIVTPWQMQAIDRYMIEQQGTPGVVLMEQAALGVTRAVMERHAKYPESKILILAGSGNNGGDGLAVLRQLAIFGVEAHAALFCAADELRGDARTQYNMASNAGLPIQEIRNNDAADALKLDKNMVVVDALFGTGLTREVEGKYARIICRVNNAGAFVVAVDIPSGIDGESGAIMGVAMRADITVTFQHKKLGHFLREGRLHTGELRVQKIGLPGEQPYAAERWERDDVEKLLPTRPRDSHKGKNGSALLCVGSGLYAGAAILCATATLRAGAGLLYLCVPKKLHAVVGSVSAAIVRAVGGGSEWDEAAATDSVQLLEKADAIGMGPGMGQGAGVAILLAAAQATKKPLVLEADALNALANDKRMPLHKNVLLTPHPGEMARLLGCAVENVVQNPIECAKRAAQQFGCVVLLKGAVSIITNGVRTCLNDTGNPGLAKGGSGDVLTGIILALLAQGIPTFEAACTSAYLLGCAADEANALLAERMLLPTDVIEALHLNV